MSETYEERTQRENAERNAKHEQLRTLGGKLTLDGFKLVPADLDPDSSSFDRYYSPVKLAHKDGRELSLLWSKDAGKITISANLPNGLHQFKSSSDSAGDIGVSVSKTPEQITREIERRLLPEYTRVFNVTVQRKAEHDAYNAKTESTLRAAAEAFDLSSRIAKKRDKWDDRRIAEVSDWRPDHLKCESIELKTSGDTIELKLGGLTLDTAKKLAAILRKK